MAKSHFNNLIRQLFILAKIHNYFATTKLFCFTSLVEMKDYKKY